MSTELNNKSWKEFILGGTDGMFDISSTSSGIDKNKLTIQDSAAEIPYITRTNLNNGISLFVPKKQNIIYSMDDSNVITIGLDTQTIFYQPYKFYTGQNIQILKHDKLNQFNGLFLVPLIKVQLKRFSWGGNGATLSRLHQTKVMIPVNKRTQNIDWVYMEKFIKKLQNKKLNNYKTYIKSVIQKNKYIKIKPLEEKRWKTFEIGDLFKLYTGKSKGLNHLTKTKDGINYLGATNRNNGVICQVEKKDYLIQKGNCIAFIRNGEGSMGYSVYKAEDFIATSDITAGYADFLNRYTGLFISTISDKVRGKYNFGYKRSDTRLKKEKLLLPVNDNNNPDFEYMEQYIINIELGKIEHYLNLKFSK